MLINLKMPTIVGILTFMSRINFVLSRVEHEKSFITSGPELKAQEGFKYWQWSVVSSHIQSSNLSLMSVDLLCTNFM